MDYAIHVRKWSSLWEIVKKKKSMMQRSMTEWVSVYTLLWRNACYLNKGPTMMCLANKQTNKQKQQQNYSLFQWTKSHTISWSAQEGGCHGGSWRLLYCPNITTEISCATEWLYACIHKKITGKPRLRRNRYGDVQLKGFSFKSFFGWYVYSMVRV